MQVCILHDISGSSCHPRIISPLMLPDMSLFPDSLLSLVDFQPERIRRITVETTCIWMDGPNQLIVVSVAFCESWPALHYVIPDLGLGAGKRTFLSCYDLEDFPTILLSGPSRNEGGYLFCSFPISGFWTPWPVDKGEIPNLGRFANR
jgi:hypothetical protein